MIIRVLTLAIAVLTLVGCAKIEISNLEIGAPVFSRPPTEIGPPGSEGPPPWMTISFDVNRDDLMSIIRKDQNFRAEFTDCNGRVVYVSEVYIENISLDHMAGTIVTDRKSAPFLKNTVVNVHAFLSEDYALSSSNICLTLRGGSMSGLGYKSDLLRVK